MLKQTMLAAVLAGAAITGVAAAAQEPAAFSGSCQFSGPIQPGAPITAVPKNGAEFSFLGTGTCTGTLADAAVTNTPLTVRFDDVHTLFDTCELGPDVRLHGRAMIGPRHSRVRFQITVDLARLAVAGPFQLTADLGGRAAGVAQFTPPDQTTAVQACAGSGVSTATLSGNFKTIKPLVGVRRVRPAAGG